MHQASSLVFSSCAHCWGGASAAAKVTKQAQQSRNAVLSYA
jgi:hypothetical protein